MAPLGVLLVLLSTAPAFLPCGSSSDISSTTSSPVPSLLRTSTVTPPKPAGVPPAKPVKPTGVPSSRPPTTPPPRTQGASGRPPTSSTARPTAAAFSRSLATTSSSSGPTPSPVPSPSPEQLVARIRALVRALRDADQLLRALQMFRDQQQFGDDAVLRVMKEDANRTLVEQVGHAMRKDRAMGTMAAIMANLSAPAVPNKHLSAKVPYSAYGKKSAKFVNGQQAPSNAAKPTPAVGKPRSGVAAAASVKLNPKVHAVKSTASTGKTPPKTSASTTTLAPFSARTTYVSSNNGTVITRIKKDPILGEYKVVIRDLTPAASSGIGPTEVSGGANQRVNVSGTEAPKAPQPPVTSTPSSNDRGRFRFQDTLAAPSTTLAVPADKATPKGPPPPPPMANRRSGKPSAPKATTARSTPKKNNASPSKGKASTTTPRPSSGTNSTTTTGKPTAASKSFQKKAIEGVGDKPDKADRQQVVVSATLRTAAPAEREEAAARDRAPQQTPILSGIFPRYGPGADLPHVEKPFVPTKGVGVVPGGAPANILLPPLPDKKDDPQDPPRSLAFTSQPLVSSQPTYPPPTANVTTSPKAPQSAPLTLTSFSPTATTSAPPRPSSSSSPPARDDERSAAGGGGPPQTVRLEPVLSPSPLDVPSSYFLGESPWIPIFVPNAKGGNANQRPEAGGSPSSTRTIVELTKLHVVEATPVTPFASTPGPPNGRPVLNDALEWRPSRSWQYAVRQDRVDANLQDLNQANQDPLQQVHLQLRPDLRLNGLSLVPLSVAESMYYRLRPVTGPADLQGSSPYEGIPGVAGVDYPAHSRPPITRFTCADFRQKGYFADPASGCQAFYVCHGDGRGEAMLCPNGTIFSQEVLVCDWWFNVDCK